MDLSSDTPFAGEFPEHPQPSKKLEAAVQRQIEDLERQVHDHRHRNRIVHEVQKRRLDNGRLVQLTKKDRGERLALVFATGEILLDRASFEKPAVRAFITANNLTERGLDCPALADRIVRLVSPDPDFARLVERSNGLRVNGAATTSLNYIVPLAPVGKGVDSPEPGLSPGNFADYGVPHGSGDVRVGIIDTGTSAEARCDGWLAGIAARSDIDPLDVLPGGPDGTLDLAAGHGTFVAGVVQQVAPGADIRVYGPLDSDGVATDVQVACAMVRAAVDDGCKILNLSFGCQTDGDVEPPAMAAALKIIPDDVVIVAAAGNYGDKTKVWPAAFDRVESVAAKTAEMQPAVWSSRGSWVKWSTVGEGIRSTYVEGVESPIVDPDDEDIFPTDAWAVWSGTSFAAPQVAGVIARICLEQPSITPVQAVELLRQGRTPDPDWGREVPVLPGL